MSLGEHALSYAGLGLEIFPVGHDKRPLHSQLEATTDLDAIEAWWRRWPEALIGHRISPHHLLLDIDPRHGGKDTWAALRAELPAIRTRAHFSGRDDGGGHVWFQRPADNLTATKLDEWARLHAVGLELGGRWTAGIDLLRHEHRYTILPPSPHPETGRPYRWAQGRGLNLDPMPMPALLAELVTKDDLPAPSDKSDAPRYRDPDSIADWYSETHGFGAVLAAKGWVVVAGDGEADGSRWRHSEATTAVSATIRHGCLFVYSTSTPFEATTPDEPHGYTPFRAWATLEHSGDLKAAGGAARREKDASGASGAPLKPSERAGVTSGSSPSDNGDENGAERRVILTPASAIELRRVKWCWDGRLALGTLALLAGPEGLGKSTLAATIGASLTRGTLAGEYEGHSRAVLVCATEDSWRHTIAPRFLAADADLSRVYRVEAHEADITLPLSLPDDLGELAHQAEAVEAGLLVFDPLISRLSARLDSHKDAEVRQALEPLVSFAEDTGLAIVGLIHHNKSGSNNPLELVMASKAFTAVARSVHTVIRDPDEGHGGLRIFGTAKNNLGTLDLPLLAFQIEPFTFEATDGQAVTGRIAWEGERLGTLAGLIEQSQNPLLAEAVEWLRDYIGAHGGEVGAKEAKMAADANGIATRTLERAAKVLGVGRKRTGYQGSMRWSIRGEIGEYGRNHWSSAVSPDPPVPELGECGETGDDQENQSRQDVHTRHNRAPHAQGETDEDPPDERPEISRPVDTGPYVPKWPVCANCGTEAIGNTRICSFCLTEFIESEPIA